MEKHNVLYSDKNLKENIAGINYEAIEKASHLLAKQFSFKDDPNHRLTYGVIAQEVEAIGLNELVHLKEDGTKGVDYTSLLMLKYENLLINFAMLSQKVETLKEEIDKLKKENKNN